MKISPHTKFRSEIFTGIISLAGVGLYALLAWGHAHGQVSVIDEGMYLYKGYLFATGEYVPFQDYGPLTNHMPLSFLIPGWFQTIFGPGIWVGRSMAIGLAICMLLGLWLASRRLVGNWWAAAAVWSITLNSMLIKIYSQAISQVLVACMLIWVVVLTVGKVRARWQILAGVVLSAILFFTRINMAPVLLIVILFIFWQHGRKMGLLALSLGAALVIFGHLIYWPDILKLWAKWIPVSLSPFLNSFRLPQDVLPLWDPAIGWINRYQSLWLTLKLHFLAVLGIFTMVSVLISSRYRRGELRDDLSGLMLVSIFGVLFIAHAVASLGLNYCVYCLRNYAAFFSPVGIILLGLFGWKILEFRESPALILVLLSLLLVPFVFGFTIDGGLFASLLSTDITKISGLTPQPGTTQLSVMLTNKLGVQYDHLVQTGRWLLIAAFILVPLAAVFVHSMKWRRNGSSRPSFLSYVNVSLMAWCVLVLSLTTVSFSGIYDDYDCGEDVVAANASAGKYLSEKIPEGSRVYWGVGRSPIPLLYLTGRQIYPAQLNGDYTYLLEGDTETVHRFSYWNEELAVDWLQEADFVIFEERVYSQMKILGFDESQFDEITKTIPTNPCRPDSSIMIFNHALE
jgi:hypothetical protein